MRPSCQTLSKAFSTSRNIAEEGLLWFFCLADGLGELK